jgi:hypothetical protein
MVKRTKTMIAAGGLALALAGTGAGVAAAQTTSTPPGPPTATSPAPANTAPSAKHTHHRGGLQDRMEHGEFTMHAKTGDKVMDAQRGVVTEVNAGSVTVKSTDGFTATYTISPTTKVHKDKKTATVSQIALNDRVRVLANKTANTDTAQRISDTGPAK